MISLLLTDCLGLYLALLLAFNKGFAYIFFWVGPVPLFISELMLLSMSLIFVIAAFRIKLHFGKKDFWVVAPLALYWLAGLVAVWPVHHQSGADVIDTLKRSALCYYSLFAFLSYALVDDRDSIKRVLFWMFFGGILCVVPSLLKHYPGWFSYPHVGIAAVTSVAFASIFSFFQIDEERQSKIYMLVFAITATFVLYTKIRSAFIAIIISLGLAMTLLLTSEMPKRFWKHTLKYAGTTLLFISASSFFWGAPPILGRYQRLFASKPSDESSMVEKPVETVPKENVEPVNPEVPKVIVQEVITYFSKNREGGNVSWRLRVWQDGIQQVIEKNLLFGVNFSGPFIVRSMVPYTDPDRYSDAIRILRKMYQFKDRISDPEMAPSADVVPNPPLPFTEEEQARFVSDHWYNIDFHNSHLAIFYRMGLLGLGAFILFNLIFLLRLAPLGHKGDLIAMIALVFWAWYLTVAAFNVVLEGPFMGVPYWVFMGLMLRYSTGPDRNKEKV